MFGQCCQACGVILGAVLSGTRSWTRVDPFQLGIFCSYMNGIDCGSAFLDAVVMQVMSKQTHMSKLKRFVCIRIICLVTYSNRFFLSTSNSNTGKLPIPSIFTALCLNTCFIYQWRRKNNNLSCSQPPLPLLLVQSSRLLLTAELLKL